MQGFPDSWITSSLEQEIAVTCYCNFFGKASDGAIVNCTWGSNTVDESFHSKYSQVNYLVDSNKISKILFFNLVDDFDTAWQPIIEKCYTSLGEGNVKLIGHSPWKNNLNFQFWALAANRFFTKYSRKDLELQNTKHYFLCYNRKPHEHRVELYNKLKNKNLLRKGIFTLGDENHKKSISFDKNSYSGMMDAFKVNPNASYAIPNDLMSLGNMKIWNTSFLNIVTETNYQTGGMPFLTEKTFKPIIGMRPFLILGPNGTVDWLHNNGFKTFNRDFKLSGQDLSIDDIVKAIKEAPIKNMNKKLLKKLNHNRRRFFEFCSEEEKRIGIG